MAAEVTLALAVHTPELALEVANNIVSEAPDDKRHVVCFEATDLTDEERPRFTNFLNRYIQPDYEALRQETDSRYGLGSFVVRAADGLRDINPTIEMIDAYHMGTDDYDNFLAQLAGISHGLPHATNAELIMRAEALRAARQNFCGKRNVIMADQLTEIADDPINDDAHITAVVGFTHRGVADILHNRGVSVREQIVSGKDYQDAKKANGEHGFELDPKRHIAAASLRFLAFPRLTMPTTARMGTISEHDTYKEHLTEQTAAEGTIAMLPDSAIDSILNELGRLRASEYANPELMSANVAAARELIFWAFSQHAMGSFVITA